MFSLNFILPIILLLSLVYGFYLFTKKFNNSLEK